MKTNTMGFKTELPFINTVDITVCHVLLFIGNVKDKQLHKEVLQWGDNRSRIFGSILKKHFPISKIAQYVMMIQK